MMKHTTLKRNDFCDAFHYVFTDAEIVDLEVKCQEHTCVAYFYLYCADDTFYFINLDSGVIVQYYKHLGRSNDINDEFDTRTLIKFLIDLRKELQNENI